MLDHFIDIYSKLVIGVISFIAPVTSYLLSTYLTDRHQILMRLETQKNTIDKILKDDIRTGDQKGLEAREIIESGNAKLKLYEKELRGNLKLLNYLNPKRRIGLLFLWLFISIGTLLSDALIRGNVFNLYNHRISVLLLSTSCLSFILAMLSLGKMAWKLIEARQIIVKEHKAISEATKPEIVQQETKEIIEPLPGLEVDNN